MSTKVAVVTGSNKGIGLATVKALCQKFDGDVYLTARDVERGQATVKELEKWWTVPGEGYERSFRGVPPLHIKVTGSNKGIGYAVVTALCQKFDGNVYLTARDVTRGQAAVAELQKLGLKPKFHQLDVNDQESINKLRDYLKKEYGGLDVLVNNAGIAFKLTATEPFSEQADVTLRTNYYGLVNMCHTLFPILRPHARVVNVSSSMGHLTKIPGEELRKCLADPKLSEQELTTMMTEFVEATKRGDHEKHGWPSSAYSVSKVGVSALTFIQQRAFDGDSRADIVVNAVHPGYVDTDMSSHKGHLTIEQGAEAVVYLALLPPMESPRGAYVWYDKQIVDWVNGPTPTPI